MITNKQYAEISDSDRIRELEFALNKKHADLVDTESRIQRAREILETLDQRAYIVMVKQALDALEGK